MRLTFGLEVDRCPDCGGHMNLRALVHDPANIERFLHHQGLAGPTAGGNLPQLPAHLGREGV